MDPYHLGNTEREIGNARGDLFAHTTYVFWGARIWRSSVSSGARITATAAR